MTDWSAITDELTKPLDSKHVQPPKQYGPKGDYIEAWHAQAEANRIFGFGGWSQTVLETNCVMQAEREIGKNKDQGWGVTYTAHVRVTVDSVTREDYGAGHGYDRDLGLAHESAIKEAVSDAVKRALKSFGNPFGLALYDKTKANVADNSAVRRDEAITADRELINSADTLDELQAAWMAVSETWRSEFQCNPPPALVTAKDARKTELQKEEAA